MSQVLIEYRPDLFYPPRSGVWIAGRITFVPGVKGYPAEDWETLQAHSAMGGTLRACLADGILRVISQSPKSVQGGEPEVPPLPKSQAEAIALVKKTYSLSLLHGWQVTEKRKPVLAAIAKQLDTGDSTPSIPAPEEPIILNPPTEEQA